MKTRALSLVVVAALLVLGLSWAIATVKSLQQTVADHGARIEHLEQR